VRGGAGIRLTVGCRAGLECSSSSTPEMRNERPGEKPKPVALLVCPREAGAGPERGQAARKAAW
jgi:hypothetical protein